ncbi:hypothetical protein F5884DRAFT_760528 [Xylogone sp. PMI_703]|nr:hypothetical protein F5884DRAFT_760528 [Xylogone sp. PMI_703]
MNGTLDVIPDQNGHFRHPDGYPLVVIFDSKLSKEKRPKNISWQEPVIGLHSHKPKDDNIVIRSRKGSLGTPQVKFVNVSRPRTKARSSKKATAVNLDLHRRERKNGNSTNKSHDMSSASAHNATITSNRKPLYPDLADLSIPRQPFALMDPFTKYPIDLEPYMCRLIDQYVQITTSVEKVPWSCAGDDVSANGWLPLALTDEALFHSILCGSALYSEVVLKTGDSLEKTKHMMETIRLLNKNLRDPRFKVTDGTIIAVAHLAEYECIAGNFKNWDVHIDGLYKMVELRGGFSTLGDNVKNKVLRVDIVGCISTFSEPRFVSKKIDTSSYAFTGLTVKPPTLPLSDGFKTVAEVFLFDESLVEILSELQYLTSVVDKKIDHMMFDGLAIAIQYHLLQFHFLADRNSPNLILEEACSMGALICLKTIHHAEIGLQVEGYPAGISADEAVVLKLKTCLGMIDTNTTLARELFLWIIFLSGTAVAGTKHRAWFVARLAKAIKEWKIGSWEQVRSSLVKFLWVESVHADSSRGLWDEAKVTMDILLGS